VRALVPRPDHLLVDGFPLWSPAYPQTAVLHGDARCLSIAAASILAKVTRDEIMAGLDAEAPGYGFARNCGYGTAAHRRALAELGPSIHHRRSYEPVAAVVGQHA
jgi:ribonuclease HII